jgi:hypothetical protein
MPWPCFLVRATDRQRRWLRRYSTNKCPLPNMYHDARLESGVEPASTRSQLVTDREKADMPWPSKCPCGYEFTAEDEWQHFTDRLYTNNQGQEWALRELPPGAILEAPWLDPKPLECTGTYIGPHLLVVLPGSPVNIWNVTGNSSSGGGWCVNGTPPLLTVTPSILTPRYHGFLTSGVLTNDCEGRLF